MSRPHFPVAGKDFYAVLLGPDDKGHYSLRGYTNEVVAWRLGQTMNVEPFPIHVQRQVKS